MNPDGDRFRDQGDYNREFYLWLHANRPDSADWKAVVIAYSALHRVNYWFARRTGRVPRSHAERNRRVKREAPRAYRDYRSLYLLSKRARYCEGHRMRDGSRALAVRLARRVKKEMPFP